MDDRRNESPARAQRPSIARAKPIATRLVLCLVLFLLAPASAAIAAKWLDSLIAPDVLQLWSVGWTVVVTLASLLIWRACVVWTLGRAAGTAIATLVPLGQALWWQPIFNVGCITDDVLRTGQSATLLGLWVWAIVWLWWGFDRGLAVCRRRRPENRNRSMVMTPIARTIVVGYGMLPIVVGLYFVLMIFLTDVVSLSERTAYQVANVACGALAVGIWIRAWRPHVIWSPRIRNLTGLAAGVFLVLIALCPLPDFNSDVLGVCQVAIPPMALGVWMIVTTRLWPARQTDTPGWLEHALRCGRCGYSLKGLYATRCPECGYEPTLEEVCMHLLPEDGL